MKKLAKLGLIALLLVGLVASAFAFSGRASNYKLAGVIIESDNFPGMNSGNFDKNFDNKTERHFGNGMNVGSLFANEAVKSAIESGDYSSWKNAIVSELTEEKFNELKEMHSKMLETKSKKSEQREPMKQSRESVQSAVQAGDYFAWKNAIADCPENKLAEIITEENFAKYVEMLSVFKNKDFEYAEIIAEDLGLGSKDLSGKKMFVFGRTFGNSEKRMFGHKAFSKLVE